MSDISGLQALLLNYRLCSCPVHWLQDHGGWSRLLTQLTVQPRGARSYCQPAVDVARSPSSCLYSPGRGDFGAGAGLLVGGARSPVLIGQQEDSKMVLAGTGVMLKGATQYGSH